MSEKRVVVDRREGSGVGGLEGPLSQSGFNEVRRKDVDKGSRL